MPACLLGSLDIELLSVVEIFGGGVDLDVLLIKL